MESKEILDTIKRTVAEYIPDIIAKHGIWAGLIAAALAALIIGAVYYFAGA